MAALVFVSPAQAQSLGDALWSDVSEASLASSLTSNRSTSPAAYRTLRLDRAAMARPARAGADGGTWSARSHRRADPVAGRIDGVVSRERVARADRPGIQARYPQIRTYVGQGRDIASATVRLSLTPAGFAAMARTPQGTVFVDAYAQGDDAHYLAYFHSDLVLTDEQRAVFENEIVEDIESGDAGAAGPHRRADGR